MIIDMHTHVFPDKIAAAVIDKLSHMSRARAFTDGSIHALIESMKNSGVDKSVVLPVATNTHQVEKVNDSAAALTEKFSVQGIISFACIHPDYENFRAELSRVKSLGLRGVKIHPIYQGVDIDDKKFLRILDRAAELGLIVVTHAGLDIGFPGVEHCSPKMIRRVVETIGDFKFILAHMGGWKNWNEVAEELAGTNVFIDTAFSTGKIPARSDFHWDAADLNLLGAAGFMTLYKIFGADKILFGTDSPWSSPAESIDFIQNLPLSDAEKNKILGGNAENLLG